MSLSAPPGIAEKKQENGAAASTVVLNDIFTFWGAGVLTYPNLS